MYVKFVVPRQAGKALKHLQRYSSKKKNLTCNSIISPLRPSNAIVSEYHLFMFFMVIENFVTWS